MLITKVTIVSPVYHTCLICYHTCLETTIQLRALPYTTMEETPKSSRQVSSILHFSMKSAKTFLVQPCASSIEKPIVMIEFDLSKCYSMTEPQCELQIVLCVLLRMQSHGSKQHKSILQTINCNFLHGYISFCNLE